MKCIPIAAAAIFATTTMASADALQTKECAIFASAAVEMAKSGHNIHGVLDGCPQDLRVSNADITRMANPPRYRTPVAGELHAALLNRGVPNDLATQIALSPSYQEWVALRIASI